jgi:hypothetical protein
MAYQLELDFGEENAVEILDGLLPSAIDRIYNMMTDSGARPLVVSRLIAGEIASTIRAMMHGGKGWRRVPYRDLMNRVKGCRELQRNLLGCEKSSVGDHLDMDGPQFRFVFERLVQLFRTALHDAGVDDDLARTVMVHFESEVAANDERLRLELGKHDDIEVMRRGNAAADNLAPLNHFPGN